MIAQHRLFLPKATWVFILTLLCTSEAFAIAITFALANTNNVPVKSSPDGQTIDTLPLGTAVGVIGLSGSWAKIMYFPKGETKQTKQGWVNILYLQVTSSRSSSCESEYQSGAEVCIEVTDADIDCDENYSDNYYNGCEVEIDYGLETDYRGQSSLNVDIECEAEISYKSRSSYNSSGSDSETESHSLYAGGSDYNTIEVDFSFSSYKEVYSVELDSAECEIESVNLW